MNIENQIMADELRKEDGVFSDSEIEIINAIFEFIKEKKDKVFKNEDRYVELKVDASGLDLNTNKIVRYFSDLGYLAKINPVKPITVKNILSIEVSWAEIEWDKIF